MDTVTLFQFAIQGTAFHSTQMQHIKQDSRQM